MFGSGAFGSGTGFGQQQQQQQPASVFGQQQPQQQSAFGGFGSTSTPSAFGASTTTTAFGQPAQPSVFGSNTATTGFGANTTSAFGQARPSAFGSTTPAFGAAAQPAPTGFGGGAFGGGSSFGSTTAQAGSGLFGSRPATQSAFGATATPAPSAFGAQPQQQPSAFGGMGATTSAFGQTSGTNQGTAVADFTPTQERDLTTGVNNFFQTITAMPQYKNFSLEELRLQDYMQNRKTGNAAPGGFGAAAPGGFGAPASNTSLFGQPAASSAFGQQTTSAFGQPQQQAGAFGSTGTGLFGQQQPSTTPAFGAPATGATGGFGNTGFGASNATPAFGATSAAPAFGAAGGFGATAAKPFSFGASNSTPSQPATGGFGATTSTPGFGQAAGNTGFGGFGQKPAGQTTTGFGGTGGFGGFGATAASKPTFSFGATSAGPTSGAGTTGFGGFGTNTTGAVGGFGAQTSQPGGLFGANKPAAPTTSLFGNTQQQTTTPSFGFGGTQQNTGFGATTGGLFGQKPATNTTSTGGLFGNTQLGGNTSFGGFGQQQTGGGSFNLPAQGGLTSFGTAGLQPGQAQQPLVATVDKSPYGSNPLFNTTQPTQQGTGNQTATPSAVAVETPKKPAVPHYPISPRVVSKIKLRGFTFGPTTKPAAKKMTALDGVSDDAVLGSGAFSPRPSNKRLVFNDNVDESNVAALVNQKSEKPKILFNPKLELIASQQESSGSDVHSSTEQGEASATTKPSISSITAAASKNGYSCSPTLEALSMMSHEELKHVENFTVKRRGYGEVSFDVPVDLSDIPLQDIMGTIVIIETKTVVVYPNESTKPALGHGLNAPATVKLENCYTTDKDTKQPIRDPEHARFKLFLNKLRKRQGVEFLDYDMQTGTWTFKVKHF
ncbi:nucleoporin autopeptidase-domain-containing protein [Radiomyces spectabilis]|uniref:nucleoporin autopeptidase-domain-containing protein n=1 Tax=Radiomyces spectabilis TaxID=64574 RepID=UPI0022210B53|nr:nucleoporin autopeptidase-domain-containing protein [Radiomyces spectabilis]KAI8385003.1 nucleoporin autopeptidase-domain-containing protein [Radiomyces spectabilis]